MTIGIYSNIQPDYLQRESEESIRRIVLLLSYLKREIDCYYYSDDHATNYEHIYYLVSQINDDLSGNYDNPAIQPLIENIWPEIKRSLVSRKNELGNWDFLRLTNEALKYIECVVWRLLSKDPKDLNLKPLLFIEEAFCDSHFSRVDLFTLNHDIVLEYYLKQEDIKFANGFGDPINEVRYWDSDLFGNNSYRIRLIKLHGSVDWCRFIPKPENRYNHLGIPPDLDFWHTRDAHGNYQLPEEGGPEILVGTFNKILEYSDDVYITLHYEFYQSLKHTERLVISGYGFGDKMINTRVIRWIHSSPGNKIIVIHPYPAEIKRYARKAISKNLEQWVKDDRLVIIPKKIEDTSWQEIKNKL